MNHHSLGNGNGWGLSQPGDANAGAINATGQLFSHLTWIAAEADTMEALEPDLDPSLGVTVEGRDDLGAFESVRLSSADRDWLLVLNRGEDAADFDLKRYGLFRELLLRQYHADDAAATGYEDVSLTSGVPLWMQTGLPLTPDTATAGRPRPRAEPRRRRLQLPGRRSFSDALTLADLSGDGELSGDDADLFAVAYLDGLTAFRAARPDAEYWSADMSLDGVLDGGDIAGFLAALRGAGVSEARLAPVVALIPEPAAAAILLACGSLLLRRMRRRLKSTCSNAPGGVQRPARVRDLDRGAPTRRAGSPRDPEPRRSRGRFVNPRNGVRSAAVPDRVAVRPLLAAARRGAVQTGIRGPSGFGSKIGHGPRIRLHGSAMPVRVFGIKRRRWRGRRCRGDLRHLVDHRLLPQRGAHRVGGAGDEVRGDGGGEEEEGNHQRGLQAGHRVAEVQADGGHD